MNYNPIDARVVHGLMQKNKDENIEDLGKDGFKLRYLFTECDGDILC